MGSPAARAGLQHRRDQDHLRTLQQRLNACQTNIAKAQQTIQALSKQLAEKLQDESNQNLTHSVSDRIYFDLVDNHGRAPILGVIRWKRSPGPKSSQYFTKSFGFSSQRPGSPKRTTY
jgi:uncharacterized coiled-coil protein SlyX